MAKWHKFVVIVVVVAVVVFKSNMWHSDTEPQQMPITFGTKLRTTLSGLIIEMERPCAMLFRGLMLMLMTKIIIIIIFIVVVIIIIVIIIIIIVVVIIMIIITLVQAIVSKSFTKLF